MVSHHIWEWRVPSLNSILPELAPIFGLSTAALYERQRALVDMKMLPAPVGRGRGAGAKATPSAVALLAVACLATDNLSDTDDRVREIAQAPFRSQSKRMKSCPLTGKLTFVEALAALFDRDNPPNDVLASVSRLERRATLVRIPFEQSSKSNAEFWYPRDVVPGVMQVRARLDPYALNEIWNTLYLYRLEKE